jgi:hypothetical protein
MSIVCGGGSLFGPGSQYIKVNSGDLIAVKGSVTSEKIALSDLRMPYKKMLKGRVMLKPGQANYLLNHLGLGDNATFLCIKAKYSDRSVIEEDNYIRWFYYDEPTAYSTMAQMMVLTGNSTNRIKQIYLTNPNTKHPVTLEIMAAVIDDSYSFFSDSISQSATSFTNIEYTDIHSHVVGESIVINDKGTPARPLIYFMINNIDSIERDGRVLTIDDSAMSTIILSFKTEYDAVQAQSLINYVTENPGIDIDIDMSPVVDSSDPVIYFYPYVDGDSSNEYIRFNGATSSTGFNTSQGLTFSTSISFSKFASYSVIGKQTLIDILVMDIDDNRDGQMSILPSNVRLISASGSMSVGSVVSAGTYSMSFEYSDIALNYLDRVDITLRVS